MMLWLRQFIVHQITLFLLGSFLFLITAPVQADNISVSIQINSVCGDAVIEAQEQCEGADLNGQTCQSIGYLSGDLSCTAGCLFDTSDCTPLPLAKPSGGVGGSPFVPPQPAQIILKGKAYPNAVLNALRYGEVFAAFEADNAGFFEHELNGLFEGTYILGLWAKDESGRKSGTVTFPVTVFWGMSVTINGIFIPPTVSADTAQKEISVAGRAFPGSRIRVSVPSKELILETAADASGAWSLNISTASFSEGSYFVKAKAFFASEESPYSGLVPFWVGPYAPLPQKEEKAAKSADLNRDGSVNLVDLSILLFWWGKEGIDSTTAADINSDMKIDITDFSIMMYWWTG